MFSPKLVTGLSSRSYLKYFILAVESTGSLIFVVSVAPLVSINTKPVSINAWYFERSRPCEYDWLQRINNSVATIAMVKRYFFEETIVLILSKFALNKSYFLIP